MSEVTFNAPDTEWDEPDYDEHVDESTVLDDLKSAVNEDTEESVKWYPVPARDSIELGFSINLDFDLLRSMFKKATNRKTKEMDPLRLAHMVLSHQTRGLKVKGREVTNDGSVLTLVSPKTWELFEVGSVQQAIKKIMKFEGHIIALMQEVLDDSGYGDVDIEADDPLNKG